MFYFKSLLFSFICYVPLSIANNNITELSDEACQKMNALGVMSKDAPVQCDRLRQVNFEYVDFEGSEHNDGVMVVMDAVAPYIANIFDRLYQLHFPIHSARPITAYQGDDQRSMKENNSSAFNYRGITGNTGKRSLSLHAYGLAVDINPIQNPFIEFSQLGTATFSPASSVNYVNRMRYRLGKEQSKGFAEEVVGIFADNGFLYWGGFWDTPIDYQHFQVSRSMANLMSVMTSHNAKIFFTQYVDWYRSCKAMYPVAYSQHRGNDYVHYLQNKLGSKSINDTYKTSPEKVLRIIQTPFKRSALCVENR